MGGGGAGRGNGQQQQQPTANGGDATEAAGFQRGLDSGLAKAAPSAVGLSQKTYRSFRRRLELFGRQCLRRGKETAVEGAYLVMSQLQDVAWDAAESIDYDDIPKGSGIEKNQYFHTLEYRYFRVSISCFKPCF